MTFYEGTKFSCTSVASLYKLLRCSAHPLSQLTLLLALPTAIFESLPDPDVDSDAEEEGTVWAERPAWAERDLRLMYFGGLCHPRYYLNLTRRSVEHWTRALTGLGKVN